MAKQAQSTKNAQAQRTAELAAVTEVAKNTVSLKPYEISDELRPVIDELGLWDNVAELRDQGYTVIKDVAPPELFDQLRDVIHTFAKVSEGGLKDAGASMLLGRHSVVDTVATLPKILAIGEASLGQGMRASQFVGSILREGQGALGLHADANWIPAPFPEHNCLLTFCMPCEGMTDEGGATRVVPGSQQLRRHPTPAELEVAEHIALEVEKGSVAVWDGAVWHSGGIRTIPGERTVLHASYQRLYTQPIDDYTYLLKDTAYVASASPELLGLIGRFVLRHGNGQTRCRYRQVHEEYGSVEEITDGCTASLAKGGASMFKEIIYESGPVARIILNRPQYLNAQSWLLRHELDAAFDGSNSVRDASALEVNLPQIVVVDGLIRSRPL